MLIGSISKGEIYVSKFTSKIVILSTESVLPILKFVFFLKKKLFRYSLEAILKEKFMHFDLHPKIVILSTESVLPILKFVFFLKKKLFRCSLEVSLKEKFMYFFIYANVRKIIEP